MNTEETTITHTLPHNPNLTLTDALLVLTTHTTNAFITTNQTLRAELMRSIQLSLSCFISILEQEQEPIRTSQDTHRTIRHIVDKAMDIKAKQTSFIREQRLTDEFAKIHSPSRTTN